MAKRIFIATFGSRGDVEPFIALAKTLKAAGYDTVLSAPPDYADWIASHGITPHRAGEAVRAHLSEFAGAIEENKFLQAMASEDNRAKFEALFASLAEASRGADLLIYSTLLACLTCIAEARRIPAIGVFFVPDYPTREFAVPFQSHFSFGRLFNALSHRAADLMLWHHFRPWWNKVRKTVLGLAPLGHGYRFHTVNGELQPLLFAVSEALVPRPRDWPDRAVFTGNLFLDEGDGWQVPPDLAAFLEDGPAPIYVGFGSMPVGLSKTKARVLAEALRLSGQRAVIAHGWGGWNGEFAQALGPRAHFIDAAPHRRLFPLMAGVVHHGGAGTTAAGFRAGRPALVTPLILDQFFFGNIVARHGAGPKPLPVKRWRPDVLAARLAELTHVQSYANRAKQIAVRMAQENGPLRALQVVQSVAGAP